MLVLRVVGTCTAWCWYCVLLVLHGTLYCAVLVLRVVGTAFCWYLTVLVLFGVGTDTEID